ncbi:uncharacterized protein TNCV_340031 [Trichonephila clavipes]|nr:uncharacterized protein TNCV_340031 [Trichonephila clavipes]
MEIRTGSWDSNSLRHKSSHFESVQRRSNESLYGRKKRSGVKRELEEKWIIFKKNQSEWHTETVEYKRSLDSGSGGPEKKIRKSIGDRGDKRTLSLNNTHDLPQFRKKVRTKETVMPSTSGYNLRPRRGTKVESLPTNEKRIQQGGPVRVRRSRDHQYRPYIEEQAKSSSRNTRSRSSQQQNCQKRKGEANSNTSISLEVLVGDINYKS